VQSLAAMVMGDLGTPDLLLPKGGDEHSYQMKPSQAAALADAGLVVWIGPELTPWLDRALDALGNGPAQLVLLDAPGTLTRQFPEGAAQDEEPAEGEDDHHHDGTDPHAWLDPANASLWLGLIAAELSRLDPDHAATYAANATAAQVQIKALDAKLKARLAPVAAQPFIAFHDAYGYFVGHYGLTLAGSVALGDASSPGAARLVEIRDLAAHGAVCIFPEVQHDPKLVDSIAQDAGVKVGGALDPSGSSMDPGPGLYPAMLTSLADTLVACLTP
jgi:zinc transport system substrate-binding protein